MLNLKLCCDCGQEIISKLISNFQSLLLLHHLLLHGSDRVVRAAQDRLYEIRSLQDYHVIYEPGFNLDAIIPPSGTETKDAELNVRVKAKELVDLVQVMRRK